MGTLADKWNSDDDDGEYSVIGDKGEIGFIDYEQDKSVYDYNPYDDPVFISVPFPMVDGKPQSTLVGETTFESITIKNNTSEEVDLWGVKIYASNPENSFTLSLMKPPSISDVNAVQDFLESFSLEDRVLQPGDTLTVWLSCKPKNVGLYTTAVHFDMSHSRVERVVFLLVDDTISRSLVSKKPYSRSTKKKYFDVGSYVVGSRPARATYRASRKKLPLYEIPNDIRLLLENKQIPDSIRGGLTRSSYGSFFKTLVIMEELQLEEDMSSFSMECVTMSRKGSQYLTLVVPGLAERRPSLVHGDAIFAKLASSEGNLPPYQGFIHRVEADEIYLKFAKEFHKSHRDENLYNVQFTYCRFNMRRLYQAIDAAGELETMLLFPSEISEKRVIDTTPAIPISCNLNEEQMFAVEMILGCKGIPPYLIHGPPGTGKTMTIVEAILQLYRAHENSRILVCAPSNSAADHLLKSLLNEKTVVVQEHEIFRLNAASRPYEDVDPEHIRFCFFDEQVFKCPPLNALMRYKIIVSTYMSSSLLCAEGLELGHFSHIFLDEAGQASEPEIMVPLANFCCKDTAVVLAGDPMQLGPVVYSKEAESHGLGKSYMERLFECEPYYCGDENYVTKLVRNYRSHPDILYLPSTLFYGGELIASTDDSTFINPCADLVSNGNFPILFIGIQGCDEREGGNPSWFNRIEISKVVEIIRRLLACEILSENDIGIIAPYRQQVLKLKTALERLDMADIKVGSVEQFQGQERKVIIVSTVRSTIKHHEFDRIHCLGFLSNPKRFNVAVTRAISLLIIIGNPHIIAKDPYWNKLLWYCVDNNSYHGCILPEREEFETTDPIQGDHVAGQEGNSLVQEGKDSIQDENVWVQEENGWGHKGNDWGQEGNEWGQEGNDWNQEGNGWGQESSQWAQEENDSGQEMDQWVQEEKEWGQGGNGWMEDYKKKGTPLPVHKGNNQGSGSLQINTLAVHGGNDWPQDSWERNSNLPVKDEDEWSDGWK